MEDTRYSLICEIRRQNRIFRRACSQVILLNHKVEVAKVRYHRAKSAKRLSFRYSNRLKLTSLEGVRNLIYEYAKQKCALIEEIQSKLARMEGTDEEYTDSEDSESDGGD